MGQGWEAGIGVPEYLSSQVSQEFLPKTRRTNGDWWAVRGFSRNFHQYWSLELVVGTGTYEWSFPLGS